MSTANNMLPPQAAPIDRTPAGAAAFNSQAGVEASDLFGDIVRGVGTVAPILGGFL
jgi:hypothetical protein